MSEDTEIPIELSSDLVVGADAIAKYIGLTRRQVYHCVVKGHLPTFKIGTLVCARRSMIMRWVVEQENKCSATPSDQGVSPAEGEP